MTLNRAITIFLIALVAGMFFVAIQTAAEASDIPADPARAHAYADGVLRPQFEAAFNDYAFHHPVDRVQGSWDHTLKVDKGDLERWHAAEDAFEQLRRAMRKAEGK